MDVPTLKPKANIDHIVEFLYNEPKEGTNDYGVWHRYALKYKGDEVCLFATDALHSKLAMFHKGDKVNIRKEEYEPGKFGFNVIPEEGTPVRNGSTPEGIDDSYKAEPNASEKERRHYYESKTDDKTKDIHRQVAFKAACKMFGECGDYLSSEEVDIIINNTNALLGVIETPTLFEEPNNETLFEEPNNETNNDDDLPF